MRKGNAMLYYLAYGSNLHPLRLAERVPSARLVCSVLLDGYCLAFNKRGMDDSAKCNLFQSDDVLAKAHGAIFRMSARHKGILDRFEGKGRGYEEMKIKVTLKERRYDCFSYTAQPDYIDDCLIPFGWYQRLVILGAEYHALPEDYISALRKVPSRRDPDPERLAKNEALIGRLITANQELLSAG